MSAPKAENGFMGMKLFRRGRRDETIGQEKPTI
jgi:hypothetical protein